MSGNQYPRFSLHQKSLTKVMLQLLNSTCQRIKNSFKIAAATLAGSNNYLPQFGGEFLRGTYENKWQHQCTCLLMRTTFKISPYLISSCYFRFRQGFCVASGLRLITASLRLHFLALRRPLLSSLFGLLYFLRNATFLSIPS